MRNGGRWNPVGSRAVYASLTPETAMAESLAQNRYYGIPLQSAMPRTFVAIQANLQAVLDLRIGKIRQRLKVSLTRMASVDWRKEVGGGQEPITQSIGRAAAAVEWEAIVVPSAAQKNGHNLVVFPENLRPGSEFAVLTPDRLSS